MLDPSKLKAGQEIKLQQNQKGEWQEWLIDTDGNILAVETIKPFEKSKLETSKPNNFKELKENYYKTYKKNDNNSPPISISDNFSLELPEDNMDICEPPEIDNEDEDKEPDRECEITEDP